MKKNPEIVENKLVLASKRIKVSSLGDFVTSVPVVICPFVS